MEHDVTGWFSLPWKDSSRAAGLAADVCRMILPRAPKLQIVGDGDPYRGRVEPAASDDHVEVPDARGYITRAIRFLEAFANGEIMEIDLPTNLDDYDGDDHVSRVYHTAREYGDDAKTSAYGLRPEDVTDKQQQTIQRWLAAGEATWEAIHIVQKWASRSDGGGHVHNGYLTRIVAIAIDKALVEFEEIDRSVLKWRYRDALDGLPSDEEHRLAFECAWEIGKYQFAYNLMEPVEDASPDDGGST
jgi:hypothetical protein